jgi:hypothetical protein
MKKFATPAIIIAVALMLSACAGSIRIGPNDANGITVGGHTNIDRNGLGSGIHGGAHLGGHGGDIGIGGGVH